MWRNLSIRAQLILAFALSGATIIVVTTFFSYQTASSALETRVSEQLTTLRDTRQEQLIDFFGGVETHVQSMVNHEDTRAALMGFAEAFARYEDERDPANEEGIPDEAAREARRAADRASVSEYYSAEFGRVYEESTTDAPPLRALLPTDPAVLALQATYVSNNPHPLGEKDALHAADDGTTYAAVHARFHETFREELIREEFYDIFLIDARTHHVVYTVFKEIDFGTNLRTGPHRNTGLARVYESAVAAAEPGEVVFEDFDAYTASYEAPAGFMATPVFHEGELVGVLAVQFPIGALNAVVNNTTGQGETGVAFLTGDDGVLRSQLPGVEENTILERTAEGPEVQLALTGETGVTITTGIFGDEVLRSYGSFEFLGRQFAVVTELTTREAFSDVRALLRNMLIAGVLLLGLALAIAWIISRSIANPIQVVSERLASLAQGRFVPNIESDRGDEIGELNRSYNKLSARLRGVIGEMQHAASALSSASAELMANVQAQQAGATEQAAAVEETKQSVHVLLQSASSIAQLGDSVLNNARDAQNNANVIGSRIHELSSNSANITEILNLIKDIANKSEMLALNAALEGTKAGDAGRGFSLVATQMQRLAEQVMGSVKRIEALTADISAASAASVLASEEAAKLATETTASAQDITAAVQAQQAGTQEVDSAMDEVNEVARRSVDVARDMVSSANSLLELARGLQGHVEGFDFSGVEGAAAANTDTEADATSAAA